MGRGFYLRHGLFQGGRTLRCGKEGQEMKTWYYKIKILICEWKCRRGWHTWFDADGWLSDWDTYCLFCDKMRRE